MIRVRVLKQHDTRALFHEWYLVGPVKADRLGRRNPFMYEALWLEWRCNNPACPALARINIADIVTTHLPTPNA